MLLSELAERCERATGPDRELDCLIHCAVKGWVVAYEGMNVFADMGPTMRRMLVGWLDPGKEQRNFSITSDSLASNYTASLDVAMTLVGNEADYRLQRDYRGYRAIVWVEGGRNVGYDGEAATAELSLCAAALKARAASGMDARQGGNEVPSRSDDSAVTNEVRQTPGSSSNHSIEIEE